ncbi:MAG: ATP phosphoribosyltransferase regulatory subunit [Leptospiraceae bacterium]|nr:ATP phosphoribosyltransferase regulatory subunit [Leptospiraceae bacterium]
MSAPQERYRSWLPHGFDFESAARTAKRLELEQSIRQLFAARQYTEVAPPLLDYAHTFSLTVASAPLTERSFEFYGSHGDNLAIRSDTTIQIIKAFANRRLSASLPARFGCIQSVYYNQPWGAGHRREVHQASLELLGPGTERFLEILAMSRAVCALSGRELQIVFGDARYVSHVLEFIPMEKRSMAALHFYNKDVHELQLLAEHLQLNPQQKSILCETPLITGNAAEVLPRLNQICNTHPELLKILADAESVQDVLFDFSLVRELSYYTGPVFEGYIEGAADRIASGGIYDELHRQFSDTDLSACGAALNLTALLDAIL